MAWTTPLTWVSQALSAVRLNEQIRDNMNETAPGIASAAGRIIVTDGANSIVERIPDTAFNEGGAETTTSTTYAQLATAGPTTTRVTGTSALVIVTCEAKNNTAGSEARVGYTVSGASSLGANDARCLLITSGSADDFFCASFVEIRENLTAGTNTFKMEYRVNSGTGTFRFRRITVIPF